jgi:hypothetical protein
MPDRPLYLSTSESSRLVWAERAGGLEEKPLSATFSSR